MSNSGCMVENPFFSRLIMMVRPSRSMSDKRNELSSLTRQPCRKHIQIKQASLSAWSPCPTALINFLTSDMVKYFLFFITSSLCLSPSYCKLHKRCTRRLSSYQKAALIQLECTRAAPYCKVLSAHAYYIPLSEKRIKEADVGSHVLDKSSISLRIVLCIFGEIARITLNPFVFICW